MGNVTAGGVNDGDDDENEFYEVFIRKFWSIFGQFLRQVRLGRMTLFNKTKPIGPFVSLLQDSVH